MMPLYDVLPPIGKNHFTEITEITEINEEPAILMDAVSPERPE